MSNQEIENLDSPPFVSTSITTVSFTPERLVEIALKTVGDYGVEIDPETVKSSFVKGSLTLTITQITGEEQTTAKPKKTRKPRGPNKKKTVKEEVKTEDTEKTEDKGNTPFEATSPTKEEAIASVKAEAGVAQTTAFSTETTGIESSDSGAAPAADNPFAVKDSAESGFDFGSKEV